MKTSQTPFTALTGLLTLALWLPAATMAQDAYEPDDDFEMPSSIRNGEVQNRTIHGGGNRDFVRFTVDAPGAYNFSLAAGPGMRVSLLTDDGDQVAYHDSETGDAVINLNWLDPGTYVFWVSDYYDMGDALSYQLVVRWSSAPADAYEPDNSRAAARVIENRRTQNRTIHELGDVDWARFTIGSAGAHRFDLASSPGTQIWLIRGSNGQIVGYSDTYWTGGDPLIARSALAAGTYFIKVQGFNNSTTLNYQLSARWTANFRPDAYEPDNYRSAAKRIRNGQTQWRSIHVAGNRDWARIEIDGSGARNVLIETRGASGDTELFLYNSNGRRLAYDDDSGSGRFSRIRAPLIMPGTYFIRVQEKGNNGTLASYTLKAAWMPLN